MKKILKYKILFVVFGLQLLTITTQAQDAPLIQSVRLAPQLDSYTVSVNNDTSYVYEVEMIINDTTAFSTVQIQISEKINGEWQTIQTVIRNVPGPDKTNCQTPLCFYRRNENVWVIYLGYNSLSNRRKVNCHFNNPALNDWSCEF